MNDKAFFLNKVVALLVLVSLCMACVDSETSGDSDSSGTGGSMAQFASVGEYLYVVDENYLKTFDISDSTQTVLQSTVLTEMGQVETIFSADTLLFLGTTSGMVIYSLKNPSHPRYVSTFSHITSCDPVVVQGQYAFVSLHSDSENSNCNQNVNQLDVIDLSNITKPQLVQIYQMVKPLGLAIDENRLFVCDGNDIVVMDATDPLQMTVLTRCETEGTPYDLIAKDQILSVTSSLGLKQYAYDGLSMQEISSIY